MLLSSRAIVISALRYQEKSLVVKCFTREAGLRSYFIHSAFSAKSRKISYFQPLTILDIEASHKNKGALETIRDVRLAVPYVSVQSDISKSAIAIFVAEALQNSIREEEANTELFDYLETALHWLDTHDQCANFHLILLMDISRFLGFYPETRSEGEYFHLEEGSFVSDCSKDCLTAEETELLRRLIGLRFSASQSVFNSIERQALLRILLDYYQFHLPGFRKPKSAEVLREVFS